MVSFVKVSKNTPCNRATYASSELHVFFGCRTTTNPDQYDFLKIQDGYHK